MYFSHPGVPPLAKISGRRAVVEGIFLYAGDFYVEHVVDETYSVDNSSEYSQKLGGTDFMKGAQEYLDDHKCSLKCEKETNQ